MRQHAGIAADAIHAAETVSGILQIIFLVHRIFDPAVFAAHIIFDVIVARLHVIAAKHNVALHAAGWIAGLMGQSGIVTLIDVIVFHQNMAAIIHHLKAVAITHRFIQHTAADIADLAAPHRDIFGAVAESDAVGTAITDAQIFDLHIGGMRLPPQDRLIAA